jgi:L,D-peptidoglycan transpeptidase YkuD (ErfK/YbiS/YcfS/YnhG family)
MSGRGRGVVAALLATALLAGCAGAGHDARAGTTRKRATPATAVPVTTAAVVRTASPVDRLLGVGDAEQVITVVAQAPGDTTAELTAYERTADGWVPVHGPWTANLGRGGFAPPGDKREGDNRTPTGAFGLGFGFGVLADPGVTLPYRQVTSATIVWDDDPTSPRYNQWVDTATESAGIDPEPMFNPPAYNYGVVIDYNAERTPGLGSAIFLHVSKGGPTAGCVAIPQDDLVVLMRWLDPAKRPRIVMGTRDALLP